MRNLYFFVSIVAIVFSNCTSPIKEDASASGKKSRKEQRIEGYLEDLKFTSSDVDLGYIPYEKLQRAIEIGVQRSEAQKSSRSFNGSLTEAVWRQRGPNNIGGRTRAIMIDASDPSGNRVWVGGVGGGVWRTEDISQQDPQWVKVGYKMTNIAVGAIAQDPNNHDVIYVGTGEGFGNLDAIQGVGIFKSTDGGVEWTLLSSTKNSLFFNTHDIFVHKNGDVYVATNNGGLFRSSDGGQSWLTITPIGSDDTFYDFQYVETGNVFYTSTSNSVFKSNTGDPGDWVEIGLGKPGFPENLSRVEMSACPSDPSIIYVLGQLGSQASNTFVSINGGDTWASRQSPGLIAGQDFTNGQAWYDLDIAVDPFNCNRVMAGGVPLFESTLQALSWTPVFGNIHVDQHNITFDPERQGRILFGNDGGIWESVNGGQTINDKNQGYVTTQFYAGAIHPDAGSPYILGGTQDNNSLQITEQGLSPANSVWGGDGVFCFIDQNEPNIQIVSSQNGNYGLSTDGGNDFGFGTGVNGSFINRSGYDDEANILYGQVNGGGFFRWKINGLETQEVNFIGNLTHEVTAVKAHPTVPNRIFFGAHIPFTNNNKIFRVDNAHSGTDVAVTTIGSFGASVSSIYMDKSAPNEMIVSLFSYGDNLENIHITKDGGNEWSSIEGDLPDIPVRWAMFDPANHSRAIIATEAGVWTTDEIKGDQTHWEPSNPDNGMPFVPVYMLVMRDSDKTVLAATHGRGLITTDVFSAPAAVIIAQPIAYEDQPVVIDGSFSVNAQTYEWKLNDVTISNAKTFNHTFDNPGTYTFTLEINGEIETTRTISVLPYLPAPYQESEPGYTGDFESSPEHFAAYTVSGTSFSRGSSTRPGKEGTHSGANAWILGKDVSIYENNTRAELYTPQYDLSQTGLFELKFWSKYAVHNRNDGFQVEYSLNSGDSWQQLGTRDDPGWYNYLNSNLDDGAWPKGEAYFTNVQLGWTQYVKDISFLAGQDRVSFRFVFRSDDDVDGQSLGIVIDDFEVTKYQGPLQTTITVFAAQYDEDQEITFNWTTGIEYHAKQFMLERSFTGFGFEHVATLNATGVVSTVPQEYTRVDQNLRDLTYYRIKSINDNTELGYHYEFYSDTIIVRRDVEPDLVHKVLTNPFTDRIRISFSSMVNSPVTMRMFDTSGKLVMEHVDTPNSVAYELNNLRFPPGLYILSIQVGENEPSTHKMFTN